jgi:hypothetical protein
MTLSSGSASALFLLLSLFAPIATAAPPPEDAGADKNAQAVELGRTGLDAYQVGDWAKAFQAFDEAERVSHSPVFLLYMARCQRNQGALLAARELYARASADVPATAPEPWHRAMEDARREAADVAARVPSVLFYARSDGPAIAELAVDGKPYAPNVEIELDPGAHRVVAKGTDGSTAELSISVEERRRRVPHAFTLATARKPVAPVAPVPPPAPASKPAPPPDIDETESSSNVPAYVTGAIGLAGVAVGAVTGLVAMIKLNEIKAKCDVNGNGCDPADEPKMDSVITFANVSTVSFIVGGVGLGASAVLFLTEPAAPRAGARASRRESMAFSVTAVF